MGEANESMKSAVAKASEDVMVAQTMGWRMHVRWDATAKANKLARMLYFMLTRGEEFVHQGQQHYEEQQQRQRSIAALKRRASALGFVVTPTALPT